MQKKISKNLSWLFLLLFAEVPMVLLFSLPFITDLLMWPSYDTYYPTPSTLYIFYPAHILFIVFTLLHVVVVAKLLLKETSSTGKQKVPILYKNLFIGSIVINLIILLSSLLLFVVLSNLK